MQEDIMLKEFHLHFHEKQLNDFRTRIDSTRLPGVLKNEKWDLGTDSDYLTALLSYWRHDYDWYHKEQELNRYSQFTCELDRL